MRGYRYLQVATVFFLKHSYLRPWDWMLAYLPNRFGNKGEDEDEVLWRLIREPRFSEASTLPTLRHRHSDRRQHPRRCRRRRRSRCCRRRCWSCQFANDFGIAGEILAISSFCSARKIVFESKEISGGNFWVANQNRMSSSRLPLPPPPRRRRRLIFCI